MSAGGVKIDRRVLVAQLAQADPIFKREADKIVKEQFFQPAVEQMKEEFRKHKVTVEIAGGPEASNLSETLRDIPYDEDRKDRNAPPNLFGFIGFEQGSDPLKPIRDRLEPSHPDGPKIKYIDKDKDNLAFRYEVKSPSIEAIYAATPLPETWDGGEISWVYRIAHGIPGFGRYLNARRNSPKPSRSGVGVQTKGAAPLRSGAYRPIAYLVPIFTKFIQNVVPRGGGFRRTGGPPEG